MAEKGGVVKYIGGPIAGLVRFGDFFSPFASLAIRLWVANVFWLSGLTKITDWDTTLFLFENEYNVPFINYEVAAILATSSEIIMPLLLVIGLGSRLAAIPLLVMTSVIQFTYLENPEHLIWAIFLSSILFAGPGRFSWDYFIRRKFFRDSEYACKVGLPMAMLATIGLTGFAIYEFYTKVIAVLL